MYINILDQNIYYQKTGHGHDLILLHGWQQDLSSFWPLLDNLSQNFTVWLIDLPGFGRSDYPRKPFKVSDYAQIVESFIKINKINKPHLLGHSLGGGISIKLAAFNPQLIEKLILEDSAGLKNISNYKKKMLMLFTKLFKILIPNLFNLHERIRHLGYKSLNSDYEHVGKLKETFIRLTSEDATSYLPKVINETLIIWGESDTTLPLNLGKKMYRLIPNSRIETIDRAGHFPHLDNQEMFLYFLNDFLKS